MSDGERTTGGRLALALSWAFVAVPLAWGVAQTVAKSLALFR
jgi:hypothetical protein